METALVILKQRAEWWSSGPGGGETGEMLVKEYRVSVMQNV
jgi:hypothetical protein